MRSKSSFLFYNEQFLQTDEIRISPANRALQYGDGLFETIHFYKGRLLFLNDHFDRLSRGMTALKMNKPSGFTVAKINKVVNKLILLNKIPADARVKIQIIRNEGGFYEPSTTDSSCLITVNPLTETGFNLHKKGLFIDICKEVVVPLHSFQQFKTCNSIPYVMAAIYAKENKLDDCLLLNNKGFVAEAISANIFIVKKNLILTPPLTDGCIEGVMRKQIIQLARRSNILVKEISLVAEDIKEADEIFLTNVIHGIRWVSRCGDFIKKQKVIKNIFKVFYNSINLLSKG